MEEERDGGRVGERGWVGERERRGREKEWRPEECSRKHLLQDAGMPSSA